MFGPKMTRPGMGKGRGRGMGNFARPEKPRIPAKMEGKPKRSGDFIMPVMPKPLPARPIAAGAMRGPFGKGPVAAGAMRGPFGKGPVKAMKKGGMVPAFLQDADKAKPKKMAAKAMAKGKKMMPAFMKKGAK